jgi:HSP20 family protein
MTHGGKIDTGAAARTGRGIEPGLGPGASLYPHVIIILYIIRNYMNVFYRQKILLNLERLGTGIAYIYMKTTIYNTRRYIMKTVTLYRPFTIEKALSDFDRYVDSFFGESPLAPAARRNFNLPAVDIQETDGAYLLEAELPGFDEKNIQVHVDGRTLTIESKKEEESKKDRKDKEDEANTFLLRERRAVSFSRSFTLPENADTNAISAAFKNGLLRMEIKKQQETQKRFIAIEGK